MDAPVITGRHTLTMTRLIPAAPQAVFAAWTQPEQVKKWFGPRGMTTPIADVDLRVGGRHHTVMRDVAGTDYPNPMIIEAVEAPHSLVLRVPDDETACPVPGAVGTLRFQPHALGTQFTASWEHRSAEQRAKHLELGFDKGWGETIDKLTAHVLTPAQSDCPMGSPLTPDHGWLHRMLGDWTYESEATMGPDQPPMKAAGTERVRSFGGYWVVGEGTGTMPGGAPMQWTVTMGFDARTGRYRGAWVGSMMGHMFIYDGVLAEDGRTVTLESEGPAFTGEGMARYRDVAVMESDDTRALHSEMLNPDGSWTRFMTARFRRAG
jgi:uncharacterized protein YndB with AHSA1/START domain